VQVIRTFNALGVRDKRVVRALREREKGGGPLGRYSQNGSGIILHIIFCVADTVSQSYVSKSLWYVFLKNYLCRSETSSFCVPCVLQEHVMFYFFQVLPTVFKCCLVLNCMV